MAEPAEARPATASPSAAADRRALVDRAREGWIRRLIDLSRRNNLLYFRPLKTGTLDLSAAAPAALDGLLADQTVSLGDLLPGEESRALRARAEAIRQRALANLEEKGLDTCFLALGMAAWPAADGGRPAEAPVLLVPIIIERRGREGRIALRRAGEAQVNLVLLHALEIEHGLRLDPESLLSPAVVDASDTDQAGAGDEAELDYTTVLDRLRAAASQIPGFAVTSRVVLGNFSFQKMAMVRDLREHAGALAAHDLIAALAGDLDARGAVGGRRGEIDPRGFDRVPPDQEFLVLDADASQQRVVAAALGGQDGVIHGPPGTGKSQTIANLIASLAAEGRRVLFVAEKRAALDVVLRRLKEVGLGHLALDLHGADLSRRDVARQLAESFTLVREALPVDTADPHARLVDRRTRLNGHVDRLHAPRPPSGLTVFDLQGRLLRMAPDTRAETRWRGSDLDRLDRAAAAQGQDLLVEAGGFCALFLREHPSPWTGAALPDGASVVQALDTAGRLARERWPRLRSALASMTSATGLRAPASLEDARAQVSLLVGVAEMLAQYDAAILAEDLDALASAMAPAKGGRGRAALAWCTDAGFRAARRKLRTLRRDRRVSASQLRAEVAAAAYHRRRWRTCSAGDAVPRAFADLDDLKTKLHDVLSDIEALSLRLGRGDVAALDLEALERLLQALASDTETPHRLPRLRQIEQALDRLGLAPLLTEIRTRKPDPGLWSHLLEWAWLASCLDRARAEDPAIAGFHGPTHDRFVDEFAGLDRGRLALASARVRRAHAERAVVAMNAHADQDALVRREANKVTRHLPLRKLVSAAPDILMALRPCWMASPLSVSQLMPADRHYFDVIIFDEASQVLPEDGVPALLRGARAIVAGDRHQLPPTTFFAAGDDEEAEASGDETLSPTEGFESLLDLMSGFLDPWPLEWHYRSRDEALIAFSNRHVYADGLVTFPSPAERPAVSHVLVQGPWRGGEPRDGEEESPAAEVQRVVELVLEHAEQRPRETLGVIALGIRHGRRVEAAVDAAIGERPDLDAFFDQQRLERFFVKNLERVQGDERDAIILTLGAGKDRAGRLDYRQFGPLNQQGGGRRLNVAVTRARRRMTLVSSFAHTDMDPARSRERGVELLRLYLEYASSGGRRLGEVAGTGEPLNPFELDVRDALAAKGLALIPQWGASRYRIDLVAQHPARPGRFVLAIECDGASYHAAPTARDRDRLRQQHLEALGWRFHRIWSTDWFMRREEEVSRALAAFEAAVAHADREDAPAVAGEGAATRKQPVADGHGPAARPLESSDGPPAGSAMRGAASSRPRLGRRESIRDYTDGELIALARWIQADGRLRTDEEIIEAMVQDLGFSRRGRNIDAALRGAVEQARHGGAGKA